LRIVSLFPEWRPVVSVTLRFLGIRRRGGEEISRSVDTVFRRKWVQDTNCPNDRRLRFVTN